MAPKLRRFLAGGVQSILSNSQAYYTKESDDMLLRRIGIVYLCPDRWPSKHAGSDPETFWLRPVMAITASVQPESGRIGYAGSDFLHPF